MSDYWIIYASGFDSRPEKCPVEFVEGSDVADHVIVALMEEYPAVTCSRSSPDGLSPGQLGGRREGTFNALQGNYSSLHKLVASSDHPPVFVPV